MNNFSNKGFVARLVGRAFAASRKNATQRLLKTGDWVSDDEKIITTPGSIVEINYESDVGTETAVYM